jgi:hypothetical protein
VWEGCAAEGNELGETGNAYKEVTVMITLKKLFITGDMKAIWKF